MVLEQVKFSVSLPNGDTFDVEVPCCGTAFALRQAVEVQHETPAACILKIYQMGRLISDGVNLSDLDPQQPVIAVRPREEGVEKLLLASGSHEVYQELLRTAPAHPDDNKTRVLGPMPSILSVLEEMSGQVIELEFLRKGQLPETLEFDGADGALLVPSLDAMPLLTAAGAGSFDQVTISVEVNSEASDHGLGVMLESSPLMKGRNPGGGAEKQPGDGKNYIKFHPGMWGGMMRIEGPGGWPNHLIGFAALNWTTQKFHKLHLVLNANGENLVRIEGTNAGEVFEAPWTNQLTDGQHLPAVYAWLDCGECEPVVIGKITMRVHCSE
ncbi:unnamed protein product [Polarella glacialis]|uniref:Ubiquitin-like domain-containing protein n=1 Tax=Polarella glacialis TaxID=89957 RepID=A0A813IB22_POLGL|nr:unnamed protein product [Polarella glacialis]CAE8648046.1 unnamed protein product [Polarella glacialis]